jgi:L-threonylcarbamoyladenylate synthase
VSLPACLDQLRAGRVVAFATDTFFALSCDPHSDSALRELRTLKGLDANRPLPLLIPAGYDVARIGCVLPRVATTLIDHYWPGKLTLIVPCHGKLAARVGRRPDGAVGLRVPEGAWLLDLLAAFDGPLVGTSANPTGAPPAASLADVQSYFSTDRVVGYPGESPGGAPSTVLSLADDPPKIVREGAIPGTELLRRLATGVGA